MNFACQLPIQILPGSVTWFTSDGKDWTRTVYPHKHAGCSKSLLF